MTPEIRIESVAGSHQGRVRTNNEDSFCERAADGLWVVADGMGGHERGEWASAEITAALATVPLPLPFDVGCRKIAEAIHTANRRIFAEAQERGVQMGSTVVALYIEGRRFALLWVGDSRLYLLRGSQLYQLSRDHTQVQELVDRGLIHPDDARNHPMSHILARAVGVQQEVEVDVIADEVEPDDVFLLCSDGLSGQVSDDEIRDALRSPNLRETFDHLLTTTLDRGAPDNVTLVLVSIDEVTQLSAKPPVATDAP